MAKCIKNMGHKTTRIGPQFSQMGYPQTYSWSNTSIHNQGHHSNLTSLGFVSLGYYYLNPLNLQPFTMKCL